MTLPRLNLELITQVKLLENKTFFSYSTDLLDYLGSQLKVNMMRLLTELGVKDSPVIKGTVENGAFLKGAVYIAQGAVVEPTAFIEGPCYIGPHSQVRHGAYIRANVFVGSHCVVGHTTEVKGSVFCDHAKAGHFAYVGDSFLGQNVNLGAGTKLANLKFNAKPVAVIHPENKKKLETGMKKLGGILADNSQTGCNSVLSPGSILMPNTHINPCEHFFGIKWG